MNTEVTNNLKSALSKAFFSVLDKNINKIDDIRARVLGKGYELSITFVGNTLSKRLNKKYRGKDSATDILSFPISKKTGELIFNPEKIQTKSRLHDMNLEKYLIFLVIHGILHLKGMDHGSKMEKSEKKLLKFFY